KRTFRGLSKSPQHVEPTLSGQHSNRHDANHCTGKSEPENVAHVVTSHPLSGLIRWQDGGNWRLINQRVHDTLPSSVVTAPCRCISVVMRRNGLDAFRQQIS